MTAAAYEASLRYESRYVPLEDGMYWHLLLNGEKVNGGLATDDQEARRRVSEAETAHRIDLMRRQFQWDYPSRSWR
jgi:hypothetical protein